MLKLNVQKLIKNNTFFSNSDSKMEFIKENNEACFGEEFKMYYFYRRGYNITFVYDEVKNIITSEQVEITVVDEVNDGFLKSILFFNDFRKKLNNKLESFYSDEYGEKVAFLENGVNLHFNNSVLEKITSKSGITRNFVMKFMNKVK